MTHDITFLLWLALSIQGLQEMTYFDNICTFFLNKTSGQILGSKKPNELQFVTEVVVNIVGI